MSNTFKNGSKRGRTDAAFGHDDLPSKQSKPIIDPPIKDAQPLTLEQEYRSGYVLGQQYAALKLQRQPQSIVTPQLSKKEGGAIVGNANAFAGQIELLQNLRQYLLDFQERLDMVSKKYASKLEELHDAGLMDEIHRDFLEEQLEPTRNTIRHLINHIGYNDIPEVEKLISRLEEWL